MMCGLGAKQSLRPLPDLAIHECRMRAGMAKLPMPNLAEVDRVGQQFVERESRARPAHTGCSRICGPLASGESSRIADCLPDGAVCCEPVSDEVGLMILKDRQVPSIWGFQKS